MAIQDTIKVSKNKTSQWTSLNPILELLEIGYDVDLKVFKIGDGINKYNTLPYVATGAPNALFIFLSGNPNNLIKLDADGGILLSKETFNGVLAYMSGKEQGPAALTPPDEYNATMLSIGKDVFTILSNITNINNKITALEARPLSIKLDDTKEELTSTWSSDKINDSILQTELKIKADITSNPNGAYDALVRISDLLENNTSLALVLTEEIANTVRFNAEQTLTHEQKKQARDNIGAIDTTVIGDYSGLTTAYETGLTNFNNSPFFESAV